MDYIEIEDLEVLACHGVKDEEKVTPQRFLICAKLYLDYSKAAKDDDLTETVSYSAVCKQLTAFLVENCFNLIETLAQKICSLLLETYPKLVKVEVTVKKPDAPMKVDFKCVSATAERAWHNAFIALGSNLGDRQLNVDFAIDSLYETDGVDVVNASQIIESQPVGGVATEPFLNGVVEIRTYLNPDELLEVLNGIEDERGRTRDEHWGNRTLDLDILLYDDLVCNTPTLTIPHTEMNYRGFVLEPLLEIAPNLRCPATGEKYREILWRLQK